MRWFLVVLLVGTLTAVWRFVLLRHHVTAKPVLFDPNRTGSDPEFIDMRDRPLFQPQRDRLEVMWVAYEPHADPNFLTEFPNRFHQRFWELYLGFTCAEIGLSVSSTPAGPDIKVSTEGPPIWIEAIAPGPGEGPDAASPPQDGGGGFLSVDPIILRLRSAIETKHQKYQQYLAAGIVSPQDPFIVAISDRNVPLAALDFGPPNILKAVFAIGDATFSFTPGCDDDTELTYPFRRSVRKSSGALVDTTVFQDRAYAAISAIIMSCSPATNLPQLAGSDFRLVHNPKARNKIARGLLKRGEEYSVQGEQLVLKKWNAA